MMFDEPMMPRSPACHTEDSLERTLPVAAGSFSLADSAVFSSFRLGIQSDTNVCPMTPTKSHHSHSRRGSEEIEVHINSFSPSGVVLGTDDPRLSPLPHAVRSPGRSPRGDIPSPRSRMSRHHSTCSTLKLPTVVMGRQQQQQQQHGKDRLEDFLFWSAELGVSPPASRRPSADFLTHEDTLEFMLDTDDVTDAVFEPLEEGYSEDEAVTYEDDECVVYKVLRKVDGMFYSLKKLKTLFTNELLQEIHAMHAAADFNSIGYKDSWLTPDGIFYVLTDIMYPYYDIPHAVGEDVTDLGRGIYTVLRSLHASSMVHGCVMPDSIVASDKSTAGIIYKLGMYHSAKDTSEWDCGKQRRGVEVDMLQLSASLLSMMGCEEVDCENGRFAFNVLMEGDNLETERSALQELLTVLRSGVMSDQVCFTEGLSDLLEKLLAPHPPPEVYLPPPPPSSACDHLNLLRQAIEATKKQLITSEPIMSFRRVGGIPRMPTMPQMAVMP